ncbi:phosphatase PAP2 family protein [Streptomyces sp. NPDC005438]|uniref:phosphatase PAP2 family protein n=1 Tax=Streptomyces sp. NPDC005438 TaxID=3156880 RepID=UPI0033A9512B
MDGWENPDVDLLKGVNSLTRHSPDWLRTTLEHVGEYGLLAALVLLCGLTWWRVGRVTSDRGVRAARAAVLWAPVAALLALVVNVPIRAFVERPRPFTDHDLAVLGGGHTDYSFVSDHTALAMAVAVALLLAHRRLGLVGFALALAEAFCRLYAGVHYPTDVLGGMALGATVTLLLAPLGIWALTPVVARLERGPSSRPEPGVPAPVPAPAPSSESDRAEQAGLASTGGSTPPPPYDRDLAA